MELLAPAGGFDQLHAAIEYGADAVYLAADRFGMRARACNFAMDELADAVDEAHANNVKVYVACNVMIMEDDLKELPGYLERIGSSGADALIVGDMGAFGLAQKHAPNCKLHVSTQASVANSESARMWEGLGASRIVCAREMTLAQIAEMRKNVSRDLEIEAFVHGAQCMAQSSRCLISSYLTGRSGNKGECTQPCRWHYTLEEEKRPGEHFPIEEDSGTFIMNAKDLCMIEHLQELEHAGVDSIKIEGRNKKAFYVATIVGAYRKALDNALSPKEIEAALLETASISHRPYSTGFYFGDPQQACDYDGYEQETVHVADVTECEPDMDRFILTLRCRNRFEEGEVLEVISPRLETRELEVRGLHWVAEDGSTVPTEVANRAVDSYSISSPFAIASGSFLRRRERRRTARHL